jgi:hypothetical protein
VPPEGGGRRWLSEEAADIRWLAARHSGQEPLVSLDHATEHSLKRITRIAQRNVKSLSKIEEVPSHACRSSTD